VVKFGTLFGFTVEKIYTNYVFLRFSSSPETGAHMVQTGRWAARHLMQLLKIVA